MYKSHKILALIPARIGSKGVPKKNLKLLNGKPLVSYTIESALKSKYIDIIFVSTDSTELKDFVNSQFDLKIKTLRPKYLSGDKVPTLDVIKYTLKYFVQKKIIFDSVLLLQPTVPFRDLKLIDKSIEIFYKNKSDSLISVTKVPDKFNSYWTYKKKNNNFLELSVPQDKIIPRRQDLPDCFIRDGSIYLTNSEIILKKNSIYGKKISFIENENKFNVNIDTQDDWNYAEYLAKEKMENFVSSD